MDSNAATTTATEMGFRARHSQDDDAITPTPARSPTDSPYMQEKSAVASSAGFSHPNQPRYFHTRRVRKGEVDKPWMGKKDSKEKLVVWMPIVGIVIGIAIAVILVWDGLSSVTNYSYCPIMDDDFSNGLDTTIWTKEVEVGGYGNGQFEYTTAGDENIFVQDGHLIIKPTLQDESLIEKNSIIDLRTQGICTGAGFQQCVTATNITNGTIVNPVKSGRLNTKKARSIKYGKIEVTAKLPSGDWLWPAIWMLPVKDTYGAWPQSGEIDIVESRGNNHTYAQGGNNIVSSTLHWGPDPANDGWWQTNYKRQALHTTYASGFHTFGLEWSPKYLFTYIDTRLLQVGYTKFSTPFWSRGDFPASNSNGSQLVNPWGQTGSSITPFDQDFYLILNVAVGGTNGWFDDAVAAKPWVNGDDRAKLDFWKAREQWLPTWEEGGQMEIKSVKMWQQEGFNGCKV